MLLLYIYTYYGNKREVELVRSLVQKKMLAGLMELKIKAGADGRKRVRVFNTTTYGTRVLF